MTGTAGEQGDQGALLPAPTTLLRQVHGAEAGGVEEPVARVTLDLVLPHLDRAFDYLVTPEQDAAALAGTRVSVRFAGKERSGFVLERATTTEHPGRLAPLRRVVSDLPILTPEVAALCRRVAHRYAGSLMDVARLAVPPRHATTERTVRESAAEVRTGQTASWLGIAGEWEPYPAGSAFLRRLAEGQAPRAVWDALPGDWSAALAQAAAATLASGRGVLVVVPTAAQVAAVSDAITAHLPAEPVAVLQAEDGPSRRYRSFVRTLLGHARIVVGTRSAAFAPLPHLGLLVCWDDGSDLLAEPRAPYPHAREVLALRAEAAGSGLLVGGLARTVETTGWVARGWAQPLRAPRATVRELTPRVAAPTAVDLASAGAAAAARIPPQAWRLVKDSLEQGPVLVQVPRAGYLPAVACATCREEARCRSCHGPLQLGGRHGLPTCAWCGRTDRSWHCPTCGGPQLRAVRTGSGRTAEELGRSFPNVPVLLSGARADHGIIENVDERARIVVATPGAEPHAVGGYRCALLLDAATSSAGTTLGASVAAMRRWLSAAALVQAGPDGGRVMLLGDAPQTTAQALVRWDPAGLAERELAERVELSLPPAVRVAAVSGDPASLRAYLRDLRLPPGGEVLGPVPVDDEQHRAVVRAPLAHGWELTTALHAAAALRSAHRDAAAVRIQVDSLEL